MFGSAATGNTIFLSPTIRFVEKARAAVIDMIFQTWNDTLHNFPWFNLPEVKDVIEKIGVFVKDKTG